MNDTKTLNPWIERNMNTIMGDTTLDPTEKATKIGWMVVEYGKTLVLPTPCSNCCADQLYWNVLNINMECPTCGRVQDEFGRVREEGKTPEAVIDQALEDWETQAHRMQDAQIAVIPDQEWTDEKILAKGRFEKADITPTLVKRAEAFLKVVDDKRIPGHNVLPFLNDMIEAQAKWGKLTPGQAKGVLNCLIADLKRAPKPEPVATPIPEADPADVRDGVYTVILDAQENYRTLKIQTVEKGDLKGRQIVSYLAGPDNDDDYVGFGFLTGGGVAMWNRYAGNDGLKAAAEVLLADPETAGMTYAMESGRCYICNRTLTVPASLHRGMGPVCAAGGRD